MVKKRKVGRPKSDLVLTGEQRTALEDLYYGQFRSGIGMRALWEALRDHPMQKAALQTDRKQKKAWIPWLSFKNWYNSQEVAQLTRRAPTMSETRAGMPKEVVPFAKLEADVVDMGDLAYGGKRYILNIVDVVTGFSVQQTWRGGLNNRQTSRVVQEFIDVIRKWRGSWPRRTELRTDNGTADFGEEFKDSVEQYEPKITVTHGVPHRPNSQAAVESSNRTLRGVLRRLLRSKGLPQKQWPNHLVEAGYIMNTRPVERLGWISPADALNAFYGYTDEDRQTVADVIQAIKDSVNARRGPATQQKPYDVGDAVRLVNAQYMKASLRGNVSKMGPRWSITVYTILRRRQPGPGAPHEYKISDGSNVWHQHELLMRIPASEAPPDAATRDRDEYEIEQILDYDRRKKQYLVLYTGYAWPEFESAANVPADLRQAWHNANP